MNSSAPKLLRRLGGRDAALIVMGGIIGSGIFMNPSVVARFVGSGFLVMAVWIAGGASRCSAPASSRSLPRGGRTTADSTRICATPFIPRLPSSSAGRCCSSRRAAEWRRPR